MRNNKQMSNVKQTLEQNKKTQEAGCAFTSIKSEPASYEIVQDNLVNNIHKEVNKSFYSLNIR